MFYRRNGMLGKLLIVLMLFVTVLPALPYIEGRLFPVVTNVKVQVTPLEEGWSLLKGSFEKVRNCDFYRLEWRYGDDRSSVPAVVIFPRTMIRSSNENSFDKWELQIDSRYVVDQSFAVVYHDCHPLWKTMSRFYP